MEDVDRESLEALPIQDPAEMGEERQYTHRERALRDLYVKEYLTDYDPVGAAIRVGYNRGIAKEYAVRFMEEPYVLRQIAKMEAAPSDESGEDLMKKQIIAGLKREANYRGPGSSQAARVAALAKLAHLHGMEPASKVKQEVTGADGAPLAGQIVIPGVMTPDQWEQIAAQQQSDLVSGKIAQVKQVEPPAVD
jgi:hypothetical protein